MDWRIKIHRKIDDWGWRDKPNTFSLFIYLIMKANLEESSFHWQIIRRGDCVTWLYALSKKLGITVRWIRTALEHLKSTNEITIKTTNQFSIITVVCFDKYQSLEKQTTSKSTNKTTNDWQTNDKQTTTSKEYKNNNIIYIQTKNDIIELIGEDIIDKHSWELYIIWKMIENWYKLSKKNKDILDMIDWVKDMAKDYLDRKEDWTLNWALGKRYTNQWEEYFKTLPPKKQNHKNSLRSSFNVYKNWIWKK